LLHVELDLRQEAGARLVDGRAVGAKFGLRPPVLRVALQRELVGLEQRLGAGERRQQAGQGDNPEPTGTKKPRCFYPAP
jgi:hypothetical protein